MFVREKDRRCVGGDAEKRAKTTSVVIRLMSGVVSLRPPEAKAAV